VGKGTTVRALTTTRARHPAGAFLSTPKPNHQLGDTIRGLMGHGYKEKKAGTLRRGGKERERGGGGGWGGGWGGFRLKEMFGVRA